MDAIKEACLKNDIKKVDKMIRNRGIFPEMYDELFYFVCTENAPLRIIKRIHEEQSENIHCYEAALIEVCARGYRDIARYIFNIASVNISARDDYAFINACKNGHYHIVSWLIDLQKTRTQSKR